MLKLIFHNFSHARALYRNENIIGYGNLFKASLTKQ